MDDSAAQPRPCFMTLDFHCTPSISQRLRRSANGSSQRAIARLTMSMTAAQAETSEDEDAHPSVPHTDLNGCAAQRCSLLLRSRAQSKSRAEIRTWHGGRGENG